MSINSPKHSTHHILAKERWWSNNRHNLVELKHSTHQALHTLFWTELIYDKIKKIVWVEYTALREDVIQELLAVLNARWEEPENRYRPECFKQNDKK